MVSGNSSKLNKKNLKEYKKISKYHEIFKNILWVKILQIKVEETGDKANIMGKSPHKRSKITTKCVSLETKWI